MNISPKHEDALTFAVPVTGTRDHPIVLKGLVARVLIESAFIFTLVIAIVPIFVV